MSMGQQEVYPRRITRSPVTHPYLNNIHTYITQNRTEHRVYMYTLPVWIQHGNSGFIGGSFTALTNANDPTVNNTPLTVNNSQVTLYSLSGKPIFVSNPNNWSG